MNYSFYFSKLSVLDVSYSSDYDDFYSVHKKTIQKTSAESVLGQIGKTYEKNIYCLNCINSKRLNVNSPYNGFIFRTNCLNVTLSSDDSISLFGGLGECACVLIPIAKIDSK